MIRFYVNTYAVTRHFGGHEEGGWFYNSGVPLESRIVDLPEYELPSEVMERDDEEGRRHYVANQDEIDRVHGEASMDPRVRAEVEAAQIRWADENEGNIYSVLGGVKVEVQVQDHFAAHWPTERPHYE